MSGIFLEFEEDRDEFNSFVLLGVVVEVPPTPRPRGKVRRREYIEKIISKNVAGVIILNSYSVEKSVEVLNSFEKYCEEQICESMNIAMRKSLILPTKGLNIHKLYVDELIVEGIDSSILKTIEFPIEKIILLSTFSSELNAMTPDLVKSRLKRMMRYLEYLDRIGEDEN